MDDKSIGNQWKQYWLYWGLVVRRAVSNVWVRIGVFFAIVAPTAIGIVLSLKAKPFESVAEFMARPDMIGYFDFLLLAILFVFILMSIEPVRIHLEQERDIDTLKI